MRTIIKINQQGHLHPAPLGEELGSEAMFLVNNKQQ